MSSDPARSAVPALPEVHCAADYESLARDRLPAPLLAHLAGGSGEGVTVAANRQAYARHAIVPRLLAGVSRGSTRVRLAGRDYAHPFLLAPLAHQRLVHPRGELATARGAAAADACMVLSTLSSFRLEEVATAADGAKWFQLYFQPRRDDTLDLVERARSAGYEALVVTLDTPVQPPNLAALRAGFQLPADALAAHLPATQALPATTDGSRVFQGLMARAPTWDDLEWLVANARLPVWVKGVLDADDARRLVAAGAAGLVVSNHGGRSLDGAPASLAALPAVRAAVGDDVPLLLDGGIRSGTDAYKALALGADAVLVGRLQVYALALGGALGVAHLLRTLREELEVCMALTGCATPAEVRQAARVRPVPDQGLPPC